jgi:4-amino-4-deoxy-L-arabinose transferase-like glycosyltransferase
MTASDAAETVKPVNRATAILRAIREKLGTSFPRWILLAAGMACIIYSQHLMELRPPQGTPSPIADFLNVTYRLEIVNYDNLFFALPYFLAGAILCALTITPPSWKQGFINWASTWPTSDDGKWKSQATSLIIGILLFCLLLFQLGRHKYLGIYLAIWLAVIFIFTRAFLNWDKNAKLDLTLGFTPVDLLWLATLLILGFAISSFALNDIPAIIVPDEGNFWETARAIARGDIHPVFFDSGVYTFPVASSIFQGWMLRLFGISFWSWRFASVVAGVMSVIPLYLLTKEWFGRTTAVVACAMMVANPYFIAFNRMGYNNSQALFPVALCIYFFAIGARKGSFFYIWLAGLTAGFGFYTYFSAWLGLVVLCLSTIYLLLRKEMRFKKGLAILGILLAAWGVMFLPRIAYTASGENSEGLIYKIFETSFVNAFYGRAYYGEMDLTRVSPIIPVGQHDELYYNPEIYGEMLTRALVRTLVSFFDPFIVTEHFLNSGLAGVITPIFFLAGLGLAFRRGKQLRFGLPLIWLFSAVIFLSVINAFPPRHTHMVAVIPAMAMISAAGLVALSESLLEHFPGRWEWLKETGKPVLTGVVILVILYFGFQRYFVAMPRSYPPPFEDITSWLSWKIEKPVHIFYLSETERPHRIDYLIRTQISNHSYTSGVISEFSAAASLTKKEPVIIFVDTQQLEGIPFIDNPPTGFHTPVQYRHPDGLSLGYALTNTDIDLSPKIGLADGFNSISGTPVRFVLLALLIPFVIGVVWGFRQAVDWPQTDILFEISTDRVKQKQELDPAEENKGFEFHLRLRIPARRKDRS